MSLTKGTGPFGEQPAGSFNFNPHRPEHVLYVEDVPRRVRVLLGDCLVADSEEVLLLHPPGRTPTYLFPAAHVRTDCLEPSERRKSDPGMGERSYWSVRAGGQVAGDAAYAWQQPPQSAAAIARLIAFDWDSLTVFEEDEEVFVHPRDPYTRIDVLRSSRSLRVTVDDVVIAESTRPRMLVESGLPVRWYLPPEDVRTDLLEPSYTTTRCPYKGIAHYWSLRLGDRYDTNLVWSYPEPNHDADAVRGLLCFPQDRVEMEIMSEQRGDAPGERWADGHEATPAAS
jgi:uncharacterized protein (DUF427 family)